MNDTGAHIMQYLDNHSHLVETINAFNSDFINTPLREEFMERHVNNNKVNIFIYKGVNYITVFSFLDELFKSNKNETAGDYERIREIAISNYYSLAKKQRDIILLSRNGPCPICVLVQPMPCFSDLCELRIAIPSKVEHIEDVRFFVTNELGITKFSEL
jgi:hypothetical protein